jgi:hypothetical protein
MSDEWIGIVNSTKPAYQKGFDDLTIRSRPLLSILQKQGTSSGTAPAWKIAGRCSTANRTSRCTPTVRWSISRR